MLQYIHRRGFLILGLLAGLIIFIVIFVRQDQQGDRITKLQTQVRVINRTSPCTGLTTAECAYKLLRALPEAQRREINISERTLRQLRQEAARERRRLNAGNPVKGPSGTVKPPRGDRQQQNDSNPGRTTPSSPPSGGGGGGSSPSSPSAPSPSPQQSTTTIPTPTVPDTPSTPGTAPPILQTPTVTTPPVGPIGPIVLPPIVLPCVKVPPLIDCSEA